MIREVRLETQTKMGTRVSSPATLEFKDGRIYFVKSPFALKDEIKAMRNSKWHGHDEEDGRKIWSVEDCQRNRLQIAYLEGEDVYAWFDQDIKRYDYSDTYLNGIRKDLMPHQKDLSDSALTFHYQLWAAEMGVGKTLSAQKVIEKSGVLHWWWVGPKSSIPNIKREFRRWGFDFNGPIKVEFLTYEGLTDRIDEWKPETDVLPQGVIFDESSRLKGAQSQRTRAAQRLADMIREKFGQAGYCILMSGTPSPKSPVDWWAQCEIAWPGFLKEGSPKALEQRMAFIVQQEFESGIFPKRVGWKDDDRKCATCGELYENGDHEQELCDDIDDYHHFTPSVNEVAFMYDRLKGLVIIKLKKDCLTLPDKRYRKIICKPSASTLRVASVLAESAPNTMTGMTWLRELSDGFQYREIQDGLTGCPHCEGKGQVDEWFDPREEDRIFRAIDMLDPELVASLEKRTVDCPRCDGKKQVPKMVRITREVACPKVNALKQLMEECEETGRIVVFAGFTGSVDRIVNICHSPNVKWAVVRCDGRGFQVTNKDGEVIPMSAEDALGFWADVEKNPRVAFVAHPESGGMSLTLTEARMCVYWSNSFKPEYRSQSEDRIHRKGMDENLGCEIVDLIHLPTDERVLEVIQSNRKIELMTMGEFTPALEFCEGVEGDGVVIEEMIV